LTNIEIIENSKYKTSEEQRKMKNFQTQKMNNVKAAQLEDMKFYTMMTLGSNPVFIIAAITFHMLPAF